MASQRNSAVTVVKCHGKLVRENTQEISDAVKPLLPGGGRIVVESQRPRLLGPLHRQWCLSIR
jgi:hypothetical protein